VLYSEFTYINIYNITSILSRIFEAFQAADFSFSVEQEELFGVRRSNRPKQTPPVGRVSLPDEGLEADRGGHTCLRQSAQLRV